MTLQATASNDDWDSDEPTPPKLKGLRRKSSSFSAVVCDLSVGESASRVHLLNPDMTLAEMHAEMRDLKATISNNARPSITQAKQQTGGEYRIETGETVTTAGRFYLLVIVTRTA